MPRTELEALTALRGIAAMAVVLTHFSAAATSLTDVWIPSLVPHGYMAVDFFFVLSGFIMAYTYLDAFEQRGMAAYAPFLYKRFARIVPLGLAVTALILLCAALASFWGRITLFIPATALEGGLFTSALVNVAHLQGFLPYYSLNVPAWSVSLEFAAYLLFPLLIRIFFRGAWIAYLGLAASLAAVVLIHLVMPGSQAGRDVPADIARCLAEFSLGLATYRAYRWLPPSHELGSDRWACGIVALVVISALLRIDILIALCFPPLVLAFALNQGRPFRLLASRALHFIGVISFSIYLLHSMFRGPAKAIVAALHPAPLTASQAVLFVLALASLVLPFAAATYLIVERPARDALNRLAAYRDPARMPSAG